MNDRFLKALFHRKTLTPGVLVGSLFQFRSSVRNGTPTVKEFAEQLNLTPNNLSS